MPIKLTSPTSEKEIRQLKIGDAVEISGTIFTMRDAVIKYLYDGNKSPVDLTNAIIYHCGPIVVKEGGKWHVKAAGPTTSIRCEPYLADVMKKYKIRGIIGKGGMGDKTLKALHELGAAYFHAIGGAAQVLAQKISKVNDVHLEKIFGSAEAIWEFDVKDFPAIVTMDSHGKNLHSEILDLSKENFKKITSA